MFNIFKRKPKKMKVLVVVNKDINEPIDYYNEIDTSLEQEIQCACESLAIPYDELQIQAIANELNQCGVYCLNGEYRFQVINVKV